MNGRLYDPAVGRFLNVDPYVQMPDNTQNFNRYSYCLKNPLKFTDPDGEFVWLPIIAAFAVGAIIDYGMQVSINYVSRDPNAPIGDIFYKNIDFADIFISGVASSATVGLGQLWSTSRIALKSYKAWKNIVNYGLPLVSASVNLTSDNGFKLADAQDILINYTFNSVIKTHVATKYSDEAVDILIGNNSVKFENIIDPLKKALDIPASLLFGGWAKALTDKPGEHYPQTPINLPEPKIPSFVPTQNLENMDRVIIQSLMLYK